MHNSDFKKKFKNVYVVEPQLSLWNVKILSTLEYYNKNIFPSSEVDTKVHALVVTLDSDQ